METIRLEIVVDLNVSNKLLQALQDKDDLTRFVVRNIFKNNTKKVISSKIKTQAVS